MSSQMKYALSNLILWSIVTVLFLVVFLNGNTIANWGDNSTKTIMLAILFGIGYIGQFTLLIIFRKRKNTITKDERDEFFQNKAMARSFIVTLLYVFIVAISLYTYYEESGSVPVAWIWFIAYSLILVANLTASSLSIYLYRKGGY